MMNYKKYLTATALGFSLLSGAYGQSPKFTINGLGRSVVTNNNISGALVDADSTVQKSGVSGYNLFDLQTNLAVDSSFQAMAIFRARSPFGSFFGATTGFEFRQFNMSGKLQNFKYQIGDLRVELTPFTVFNSNLAGTGYESDIFKERREIQEYENFNLGNSWLLQGVSGQYFLPIGEEGTGLGLFAFTTRNTSTNETTVPDRLLSGGRLAFHLKKMLQVGVNAVAMYDITMLETEFDYDNQVYTGDIKYVMDNNDLRFEVGIEGGMSNYFYSEYRDNDTVIGRVDTSYQDGFIDLNIGAVLKNLKLKFDLSGRRVGVLFSSPSAQSRRFDPLNQPALFPNTQSGTRYWSMFDRVTSEDMYNSKITPIFMSYVGLYNMATPYGKATPNRQGGSLAVATDTSMKSIEASAKFTYLTEIQGEGTDDLTAFMVASGGTFLHIGQMLGSSRIVDVNLGGRYESANRGGSASISYSTLLADAGLSVEVLKKIDLLGGFKYISGEGTAYNSFRDGFNLITDFTRYDGKYSETILTFGARIRFSPTQKFVVNYNLSNNSVSDNVLGSSTNYGISQLFFNYTGTF